MICPRCRYEYQPGQTVCPDCEEPLVDQLLPAAAAQAPDDSWVSVCHLPPGTGSALAKGALDSSNIPSVVISGAFGTVVGGTTVPSAVSGARTETRLLMVPSEFRDEAVLVLSAVLGDDYQPLNT
ncbi:MAG: hypothetical protein JSU65_14235 [Candidatus Zixiibacteriota bacterium]|nr:MAG: hypothetical protein JSU65_14235 [candidate division Zixibacteria bacterium]